MARGWGSRIGAGFGLFALVTMISLIPAAWLAATISCWGVNVKDSLDPARYCGYGGLAGVVVAPVIGLIVAIVYVIRDARRQ
jgi:hypothetical protein